MNCLKIEIVSYNTNILRILTKKILSVLNTVNLSIVSLPNKKKFFSVLKSPFINKKAIEQFSIKKNKKLLIVKQVQKKDLKKVLDQVPLKNIAIKIRKIV